jgi:hypothetical protein
MKKKAKKDPREKHWAKQRKELGFDDRDLWNLDATFANFIYPRLKVFPYHHYYPGTLTPAQWKSIYKKILFAFDKLVKEQYTCVPFDKKAEDRQQEGLELFGKYFTSLWY